MAAAIELLSPSDTLSRLASILKCTEEAEAIRDAVIAEYIRACVYAPYHWLDELVPPRSIHTNTILSAVRRRVPFLWKDADHAPPCSRASGNDEGRDRTADVLSRLAEIGDIVELGAGFWAPGPVRIVRAIRNGQSAVLVTGGAPFEVLQFELATCLSCVGCGRFLRPDRARLRRLQVEHELQSVQDWVGSPSENLSAWTRRIFRSLAENMSPMADIEASECEIYAPDDLPGKPRQRNWVSLKELSVVPRGLRLCRPPSGQSATYDRPTYVATLRDDNERAVFHRLALVPEDIRIRLMFGFDQMMGLKRTVILEVGHRVCRASIPFKLPDPESRILAFGWPAGRASSGRGNVIGFPSALVPFLVQVMNSLNIDSAIRRSEEMGL